ncbi:MAG: hypothetical protein OXS47_09380 [Chloroflexota bacterium]|nr:hypothetical protein [Chloroflexota bacterium]
MFGGEGAAGGLRAGLLLLVVLGVVGVALSLAYERHWQGPWQLAPWITLGIVTAATAALMVRPTAARAWLARTVAVLAIASSAIGVWQHVDANYNAGSATQEDSHDHHDHSHGREENSTGASMGDVVTGTVGHAPLPSALAIAPVGLALGLVTIGLGSGRRPPQG